MEIKARASSEQVLPKCTDSPQDTTVMESTHYSHMSQWLLSEASHLAIPPSLLSPINC